MLHLNSVEFAKHIISFIYEAGFVIWLLFVLYIVIVEPNS